MKKKREISNTAQKKLGIIAIVIFVIAMGLLCIIIGDPLLKYVKEPENFRLWVDGHGIVGRLAYIGMVIVQIIVAIIPGEPFEILAGYAFGVVEGTILCLIASTLGSLCVFCLVRRFGVRLVNIFFSQEKLLSLRFLKSSQKRDFLFLIIFMIPGTPKDLLCYFAGLTDIRFPVWLLICSLGRFPAIITSTVGGNAMGEKNYLAAVLVFIITFALSALGLWIYRRSCKKHENDIETVPQEIEKGNEKDITVKTDTENQVK